MSQNMDVHQDFLDAAFSPLCKNQETQKLAKDYFKLIRSLRRGEGTSNLPPGVVSICAWIAHVRMGHKHGASLKLFQKASSTPPTAFLDSLSSIQDMLMKAEDTVKSVKLKDAGALSCNYNFQPLPVSDPPCQNCLKKQHHCLKASWKSRKGQRCVACNLRQMTCSMEDQCTANCENTQSSDMENDSDDQPLSGKVLQKSHPDHIKEESPGAGETDNLLSDITHEITKHTGRPCLQGPASHTEHVESSRPATPKFVRTPTLRTDILDTSLGLASPKEDTNSMSPRAAVAAHAERSSTKLKRSSQGILRTPVTAKKPRLSGIETDRMSSGKSLDSQQARRSTHSIQLATPNSPVSKRPLPSPLVYSTTHKELSPLPIPAPVQSKFSRSASHIPSPSPSPSRIEQVPLTGRNPQLRTPAGSLPTTPCIQRLPTLSPKPSPSPSPAPGSIAPPTPFATSVPKHDLFDTQVLLGCAIREAALAVTSYVQAHPCEDFELRLKVLDLNTRLGELSRLLKVRSAIEERSAEEAILEELVEIAEKAVVGHVAEQGCSDVRLKVKVMDLGTRLDMR